MNLELTRPLVFFDLEATDVNPATARIIQIAAIRVSPDGEERSFSMLVNPTVPIPEAVTELTGISDADVADKPTFKDVAGQICAAFDGCDVGGYNAGGYDVPLLTNELKRAGKKMPPPDDRVIVDPMQLVRQYERQTLEWATRFYCNYELNERAHQADADASAAMAVFFAQLQRYPVEGSLASIMRDAMWPFADFARKLRYEEDGTLVFAFSKHEGRSVRDVWFSDAGFIDWMMGADFADQTKEIIRHHLRDVRIDAGAAVNA